MELLTEKQKVRRQRDAGIVAEFRAMRKKYPTASDTRIMSVMAENRAGGLTSIYGIRKALQNANAL